MKTPLIVTRGVYAFPKFASSFEVSSNESINALFTSQETNEGRIILSNLVEEAEDVDINNINLNAVIVKITDISLPAANGARRVNVVGLDRVKLSSLEFSDSFYSADYKEIKETGENTKKTQILSNKMFELFEKKAKEVNVNITPESFEPFKMAPASEQVDAIATILPLSNEIKQSLISITDISKRIEVIINTLMTSDNDDIRGKIDKRVNEKLQKHQKEFYLKEQIKAAQEELKEINGEGSEIDELRNKVNSNPYPEKIKEKILSEIKRLENTPAQAAEANIIRSYID